MGQIKDNKLIELQNWVKSYPFKAPADKKLRKVDGDAVRAFMIEHNWWNIEVGNVMTHVRYFRLFPDDTLEEHRRHVQSGKGNDHVRATRKKGPTRIPTVTCKTEYKVHVLANGAEIEFTVNSAEDLAVVLKSFKA
jgi:hypothetical protein